MANQLQQGGAQPQKPARYAPLHCNRWFTGLWTQRSPLRDAATPFLYEKFYSGTRMESLIDGSNVEITSKLTVARRPGLSVYNSATFPAIDSFYEFKTFTTTTESIQVIADSASTIYNATGPNTQTTILTKSPGASQAYFQGVGNTLYIGDGVDQKKYLQVNAVWTTQNWGIAIGSVNSAIGPNGVGTGSDVAVAGGSAWANPGNITASDSSYATVTLTPGNATVGPNAPGTAGVAGFGQTWSNPSNILVNDNNPAIAVGNLSGSTVTSQELQASNFGFSIPSNATVSGILVEISRQSPSGGNTNVHDNDVTLLKSGVAVGSSRATASNWPTSYSFASYGGSSDLWGTTWSPSDINGTGFGVQLSAALTSLDAIHLPEADVDYIRVTVTYTASSLAVSDYLQGTNCGFTVPSTNTISGVLVEVQGFQSVANANTSFTVQLIKSGNLVGIAKTGTNLGLSNSYNSFGGSSDLWGTTWSPNDFNASNFGVSMQAVTNGSSCSWSIDFVRITVYGVGGPTVSLVGGGSLTASTGYQYVFCYGNSVSGHVSSPTPVSALIKPTAQNVQITLTQSTDPQVNQILVFRTKDGGSTFFELPTSPYPNTTGNQIDSNADSTLQILNIAPASQFNNPPPVGLINLTYHLQRVFGSVGNTVYYSAGPNIVLGNPNEAWPPTQFFVFPSQVVRMLPTAVGLLVFTISDIYNIAGQGTSSSPLFSAPYIKGLGLSSYNAMDVNGTTIMMFTNQAQSVMLEPSSGVSEIGFPIGDVLQNLTPANVYVAWHAAGSNDKAMYVADGLTGWYRLNMVSSPETGFSWSPKATIVGGCQAVQSVEVSPGVHKLLLGPTSSGPILQRDTTRSSDNGYVFPAFFTIGSLVLALPGQLAELGFITTEAVATGTRPGVSVLLNETSGTFQSLTDRVSDPPGYATSSSVYSDRRHFSTARLPSWARHLQIKFSWPAENFANEILTYTLYGAYHQEQ